MDHTTRMTERELMRRRLSDLVKISLIFATAGLIGVAAIIYFSPYQTCVRAEVADAAANGESAAYLRGIKLTAQSMCAHR